MRLGRLSRILTIIIALNMTIIFAMSLKKPKIPSDTTITTNSERSGAFKLAINITWGPAFNHPTFAIWTETMSGQFLETLFATEAMSTGTWPYGQAKPGQWKAEPGHKIRPAALPYWFYKRSKSSKPAIPTYEKPLPDAITAATPRKNLQLYTVTQKKSPAKFKLFLEINQTWDWNDYWTNNKYPNNNDYKTSAQPAVVYAVTINLNDPIDEYFLNPIGHSHYAGANGLLYTDLSTLSTALDIVKQIRVKIQR